MIVRICSLALLMSLALVAKAERPMSITGIKERYVRSENPQERRDLTRKLAAMTESRVAVGLLEKISRYDQDFDVRLVAIRGLGQSKTRDADKRVINRLLEGGAKKEREAIALAIASQPGGAEKLKDLTTSRKVPDPLTRGLLIEGYGLLPTKESRDHLVELTTSEDFFVSSEALRVLARRPDGVAEAVKIAGKALRDEPDHATIMLGLGILYDYGDPEVVPLPLVREISQREDLSVSARKLAGAVASRMAWLAEIATARSDGKYVGDGLLREPTGVARVDMVFGVDCTGSMGSELPQVAEEMVRQAQYHINLGSDVRVGIVRYRDTGPAAGPWEVQMLPLTHDMEQLKTALRKMVGSGANDKAASVYRCLVEGLDRMNWREGASRSMTLVCDTPIDDIKGACRVAKFHLLESGTSADVWYMLHKRTKVPDEYNPFLRASGGTLTKYQVRRRVIFRIE